MISQYRIAVPPPPVGYWRLGPEDPSLRLHRTVRPCWLHRFMMHLCFGITWFDLS